MTVLDGFSFWKTKTCFCKSWSDSSACLNLSGEGAGLSWELLESEETSVVEEEPCDGKTSEVE